MCVSVFNISIMLTHLSTITWLKIVVAFVCFTQMVNTLCLVGLV